MIKLFQLVLLLFVVHFTNAVGQQECNIHKMSCPPYSICTSDTGNDDGVCKCMKHMKMNVHSTDSMDYCIPANGKNSVDRRKEKDTIESKTVVHIQPPPESHHVIIGILVPLILVLVVIGAAYGIKKFHPVRRLREYVISRRRNRPLYEDVMMTQELDDPPLM